MTLSLQNLLKVTVPIYQKIRYSYWVLRLTSISKVFKTPSHEGRVISVAITHYNKSKVIHYSFFNFLKDPRVSEIVILDDKSATNEFENLKKKLSPFRKKIRLYKKEDNWGPFGTKIQAVSLCKEDWVLLVDGDNLFPKKAISRLFKLDWNTDTIYCPELSIPHFNFSKIRSDYSEINISNVLECYRNLNGFRPFMNTGNYFIPKDNFVAITKPMFKNEVSAADVLYSNYLWLRNGKKMKIIPGFNYYHLLNDNSTFLKNRSDSEATAKKIMKLFEDDSMNQDPGDSKIPEKPIRWSDPILIE